MSCAEDWWDNWAPEPPGTDPDPEFGQIPLDYTELDLLGPHLWYRRQWWPIENTPDIDTYQPRAA